MTDKQPQDPGITGPRNRIDIFLDDATEPILSHHSPLEL